MRGVRIRRRRRPRVQLRTARIAGGGPRVFSHSPRVRRENAAGAPLARLRPTGPVPLPDPFRVPLPDPFRVPLPDPFRLGRLRSIPLRFRRGGLLRHRVEMAPHTGLELARPHTQRPGIEGLQALTLPRDATRCTCSSGSRCESHHTRAPKAVDISGVFVHHGGWMPDVALPDVALPDFLCSE